MVGAEKIAVEKKAVEKNVAASSQSDKMGAAPIPTLVWQMSLPPLISMFIQYSYNLVDSMFVAQVSEQALAAVSLSFPITTLMNALSIWVGVAANVLIAGYRGQGDRRRANEATTLALLVSVVLGVASNFVVLLAVGPYYALFTQSQEILECGLAFMGVCAFMQVPNMVHIAIQKSLQATGNMLTPMWFQIAGVALNFALNPVLVFGLGPFPRMGVVGSAVATVLGYALSMTIALVLLFSGKQGVVPHLRGFRPSMRMVGRIFSYGLPSFVMNALGSFMVYCANLFLVAYSDTAVAFFGAYFKVQQLVVMTTNGLVQGALPIMRYNFKAGQRGRLKETFKVSLAAAVAMMLAGALLVSGLPGPILALFAASEQMRELGEGAMRIMAAGFVFNGVSTMVATYDQATDRVAFSMAIQLLRQGVLLVPLMWVLDQALGMTGIWLAFPVTEVVVCVLAVGVGLHGHRMYNIG